MEVAMRSLNTIMMKLDYVPELTQELKFLGTYDATLAYRVGDVCIIDGETCVFDGIGWQALGEVSNLSAPETPKKIVYGTCKHCGAPLKDEKCEYCGVINRCQE